MHLLPFPRSRPDPYAEIERRVSEFQRVQTEFSAMLDQVDAQLAESHRATVAALDAAIARLELIGGSR
jgi:hypothetical protein